MYVLVEVFSEISRKPQAQVDGRGLVPSVVLDVYVYYLRWEPVVFVRAQVIASFRNNIGGGLQ